jgi:peptidoglycan-associated lipoprotein
MKTNNRSMLIPFLGLLLLAQACTTARKADKGKAAKGAGSEAPSGSMEAGLPGAAEVTEASLRGKTFQAVPTLASVRFEYDRDSLDGGAMAALKANAEWLKANSKVEVQIQGHCDERGTVAYNLALGQKRSRAVRDYYRALGVPMSRMSTISFGKEKPDCADATEECWRANRRAETRARVLN